MQKWLREKGIQYRENMLKPGLYNLIRLNKDLPKKFSVDNILAENNHFVLLLPSYHPDLNSIEIAWANIKRYVNRKNVTWSFEKVKKLVNEKVAAMGPSGWAKLCKKIVNDDNDDDDDEITETTPGTSSASAGFDIMEGISILPVDEDD
ncbi:hypothetical protein EVAR_77824_1 [Eumeta japonica]|uniref:Tc1-like transposase DDE domain-containing protein n=1 Tax=Eumeta variegata TaxID=151549 RepID=A0A4C1TEJ0_EUMVA|nr:hypothetical protein EVAR_77824_1 [Eumeta japonica]